MKPPCLITIITLFVASAIVITAQDAATSPSWTSKDGRVIQAKFVKLDGEAVVVEKGGKEVTIPFAKLSAKSVVDAKRLGEQRTPGQADAKTGTAAVPATDKDLTIDLGGGVTMDFVLIRPGSFTMGTDLFNKGTDKTTHKVTLTKPFLLGKYEVTQEQWEQVMGSNPSKFKGAKNPVETVSWTDCQSFVAKLNAKVSGQTFRLPTESEWEYACRADSTGTYCFGNDLRSMAEYAWYDPNDKGTTHPVGEKKANAWGLYDMHGNVREWCADWYGAYPAAVVVDPQGSSSGSYRVIRGGCWSDLADRCTAAARGHDKPSEMSSCVGLRLARSSPP